MRQKRIMLDEEVAALLADSQVEIERAVLECISLELYRRCEISVGRASRLLDLDQLAFIRWSGSLGIPFFDTSPDEWQQGLRTLEKMDALAKRPETQGS